MGKTHSYCPCVCWAGAALQKAFRKYCCNGRARGVDGAMKKLLEGNPKVRGHTFACTHECGVVHGNYKTVGQGRVGFLEDPENSVPS